MSTNNITSNSLLILILNLNSLMKYKNELLTLQNNRIDIAFISDTHFTNSLYFNLHGYISFKNQPLERHSTCWSRYYSKIFITILSSSTISNRSYSSLWIVFLDVAQTFNSVWHEILLFKIKSIRTLYLYLLFNPLFLSLYSVPP